MARRSKILTRMQKDFIQSNRDAMTIKEMASFLGLTISTVTRFCVELNKIAPVEDAPPEKFTRPPAIYSNRSYQYS
jgi:hypothetical protein